MVLRTNIYIWHFDMVLRQVHLHLFLLSLRQLNQREIMDHNPQI